MTRFRALYESYARDIYRSTLYLSGDAAMADNIVSETFIPVWSSPEPVRLATVKAYSLTIARNLWLMERKRSLRFQGLDDAIPGSSQSISRQMEVKRRARPDPTGVRELPPAEPGFRPGGRSIARQVVG